MFKHGINWVLVRKVKLNKKVQSKYRKKTRLYLPFFLIIVIFFLLFFLSCNTGADHDIRSAILDMKTAFVVAKRSSCELLVMFCEEKHGVFCDLLQNKDKPLPGSRLNILHVYSLPASTSRNLTETSTRCFLGKSDHQHEDRGQQSPERWLPQGGLTGVFCTSAQTGQAWAQPRGPSKPTATWPAPGPWSLQRKPREKKGTLCFDPLSKNCLFCSSVIPVLPTAAQALEQQELRGVSLVQENACSGVSFSLDNGSCISLCTNYSSSNTGKLKLSFPGTISSAFPLSLL